MSYEENENAFIGKDEDNLLVDATENNESGGRSQLSKFGVITQNRRWGGPDKRRPRIRLLPKLPPPKPNFIPPPPNKKSIPPLPPPKKKIAPPPPTPKYLPNRSQPLKQNQPKWDNGDAWTAKDVENELKAL